MGTRQVSLCHSPHKVSSHPLPRELRHISYPDVVLTGHNEAVDVLFCIVYFGTIFLSEFLLVLDFWPNLFFQAPINTVDDGNVFQVRTLVHVKTLHVTSSYEICPLSHRSNLHCADLKVKEHHIYKYHISKCNYILVGCPFSYLIYNDIYLVSTVKQVRSWQCVAL